MEATAHAGDANGSCKVRIGDFDFLASKGDLRARGVVKVTIRPERVRIEPHGNTGANRIPGVVARTVYLGASTQLLVNLAHGATLQAMIQNQGEVLPYTQGASVNVCLPDDALRVLPLDEAPTEAEAETRQLRHDDENRPRHADFERPTPRPQI